MGIALALLTVACLATAFDAPQSSSDTSKLAAATLVRDRNDPLPITPTAKRITRTDGTSGFALHLQIARGVQINSERPLEIGIPLRIQFLDGQFKSVPTTFVFPSSTAKRVKGDPLPDYFVYERKDGSSIVVYGYPKRPVRYATVYYHGFNNERMH